MPMHARSDAPSKSSAMTRDEWVTAALAACVEQGLTVAIEDPATLAFLADVLSHRPADDAQPA